MPAHAVTSPRRLFEPCRIGPARLRNRTVRAAAFEGMCPDHRPSPALIDYHRAVAAGGVGMTTVAYAAVEQSGLRAAHGVPTHPITIDLARPEAAGELWDAVTALGRGFACALRSELRPHGVNVTCLAPGATATGLYDPEVVPVELARRLGIMMDPETVARAGLDAMFRGDAEHAPGVPDSRKPRPAERT